MRKLLSFFLLVAVFYTGFCPSIMAANEKPSSCHEMEMMSAQQDSFTCDHIGFFEDTITQKNSDFFLSADIIIAAALDFQIVERYSIPVKIIPQVSPIPPPLEWEKQKQTIVLRV